VHVPNIGNHVIMRTLKLILAYDGTDYVGWQRQLNGRSVQGTLELVLSEIEGKPVNVIGAGRTDAGVHAVGQVASVALSNGIETDALARAINGKLPKDIRVLSVEPVSKIFHARYSARNKTYRYFLNVASVASPFALRYAWHISSFLDLGAMRLGGQELHGRHDFSAFQSVGTIVSTPVRTISSLVVKERSAGHLQDLSDDSTATIVTIDISADGFLRYMVRAIVGTLVEIGRGRRPTDDISLVLNSKQRARAGPTAPARGLFLMRVTYGDS